MSRQRNIPNRENCTEKELDTATNAAPTLKSHKRLMAIKALFMGLTHEQVAELFSVNQDSVSRWVRRFNQRGIDGLIEGPRAGRPSKISSERADEYRELVLHPEQVNETHWTGRKFHGYLTTRCQLEAGYSTLMRWIYNEGFRLKVPRSWPDGQDEEKRKSFIELIRKLLNDQGIELWFSDECGVEGDPRPRRRFAKKGDKIRQPYAGTHLRMNVIGMVGPRKGQFYALEFNHCDTQIFQIFLDHANRDIQFERPRNLLILDNASWHKSKSLKWGRFEPLFLPPYSPDLNPIERLWLIMKAEWFSGFYAKTPDQLIDRLTEALRWLITRKDQNIKTCAIPTEL
ncbi:MAG: IS630 family transposase [Pseudomonadota bacterium]